MATFEGWDNRFRKLGHFAKYIIASCGKQSRGYCFTWQFPDSTTQPELKKSAQDRACRLSALPPPACLPLLTSQPRELLASSLASSAPPPGMHPAHSPFASRTP